MISKDSNITVIGGGTAGWISALWAIKRVDNVTLVEDTSIGTIGVGEATTPPFLALLNNLNINLKHFIQNTGATIKCGIKFQNWKGENDVYWHPFFAHEHTGQNAFSTHGAGDYELYKAGLMNSHYDDVYTDSSIFVPLMKEDKCPFVRKRNVTFGYALSEYDDDLEGLNNYALHFDAAKVAEYFKGVAISRGVKHIDDKVLTVHVDSHGFVDRILCNGNIINCDFVLDCSGQSRVTDKQYQRDWYDYSRWLPANKAVTFWLDKKKPIPSYTLALAADYGWIWEIPTQDRTGSGYIYNSSMRKDSEVEEEIVKLHGKDIEFRKHILFDSGRVEVPWVKNCVSIGLSAGFIEPLESTSILITGIQLFALTRYAFCEYTDYHIQDYNKIIRGVFDETMEFILLHYQTGRDDTMFWKFFGKEENQTEGIRRKLAFLNAGMPAGIDEYRVWNIFGPSAEMCVGRGLDLFNHTNIVKEWSMLSDHQLFNSIHYDIKQFSDTFMQHALPHDELFR